MRQIEKSGEPSCLTEHRAKAHSTYGNLSEECKDKIRAALVREQRGLCCYCMGRIRADRESMKIEHFRCQTNNVGKQLVYANLLGACYGGHGQPRKNQHCDTRKADDDVKFNPSLVAAMIETRVRYDSVGGIASDDPDFNTQLEDVLNLNLPLLKNNRKGVLDALLSWWDREKRAKARQLTKGEFEAKRQEKIGGTQDLEPYIQVAIWWLDQRLARM